MPTPRSLAAPVAIALLPLLQLIPLPSTVQQAANRASFELLQDVGANSPFSPWTLDAPATALQFFKAAAALAVFLIAANTEASPSRGRSRFVQAVACTGLLALLVGIGHRLWGATLVYGRFGGSREFLNGPFVNPNHNAEFLELAAFAGLSMVLIDSTRSKRILWGTLSLSCAAGAIATLSRGALVALAVGGAALAATLSLRRIRGADSPAADGQAVRRPQVRVHWLAWVAIASTLLVALALSLGATAILNRLTPESLHRDVRLALWRDALQLLERHPLGIGAGGFERVYPVYRTLITDHPIRFTHMENQPLQFLVEYGWIGAVVCAIASVATILALTEGGLSRSSIAICAGLLAIWTHNLFDFGLDLLGISLPVAALVGTLAGRTRPPDNRRSGRRFSIIVASLVIASLAAAAPVTASARFRDFDALIQEAKSGPERRQLAASASLAHPVDYYYALAEAMATPLVPDKTGRLEKLRLLNRVLRLCPVCAEGHTEVARTLWALSRRKQAVAQYGLAIRYYPALLIGLADEVWRNGRNVNDLEVLADADPNRMLKLCSYLLANGAPEPALKLLGRPTIGKIPPGEVSLLQGRAALLTNQPIPAEALLYLAQSQLPTEPAVSLALAEALDRNGKPEVALEVLGKQLLRSPGAVEAAKARLGLLARLKRWSVADQAVEAFKEALQSEHLPTAEAHLAAARIYGEQGRLTEALTEYQMAAIQWPDNVNLLVEYAKAADKAGHTNESVRLLTEATALSPTHKGAIELSHQIEQRRPTVTNARLSPNDNPKW